MRDSIGGRVAQGQRCPATRARPRFLLAGAAFGLLALSCGRGQNSLRHERHVVVIRQVAYQPALISAAPGDTIVWENRDLVPHTVSSRDRRWDSGTLLPDSSWRFIVPRADSLPYTCRLHPTMRGVILAAGH